MENKKLNKKLILHLSVNKCPTHPITFKLWWKDKEYYENALNSCLNENYDINSNYIKFLKQHIEIFNLALQLNISIEDLKLLWIKTTKQRTEQTNLYKQKPIRERKDNKDVLNTSKTVGGDRSYPTYRYPSKKRSLYTWRNFYKLFPKLAEKDNWNGKTSDKMK